MKKLYTLFTVAVFASLILGLSFESKTGNIGNSIGFWNTINSFTPQNTMSTTLISASDGGFENATVTFGANGWTVVNGTTPYNKNLFTVGTLTAPYAGTYSAYTVSGTTWSGQKNVSVNHFYRDIAFPAGETSITLTFYHKESASDPSDNLKIYLVSTSTTPVGGTQLSSGQIGSSYYNNTSWGMETITLPTSAAGTTQRLVFSWTNDAIAPNSAVAIDNISLVSAATTSASLSATSLNGFGNVCLNNTAGPNSFTITGTNLTTDPVTVGAVTIGGVTDYTYSTTSGGTYSTSLSITHPAGSFSQAIYVKFTPTVVQSYSGNIPVSGGGASSINVAVSGPGVNTAPTVTSGTAGSITSSGATVSGTLTAGCASITDYGIEYSTTSGFGNGTGTSVPSSNLSGGAFSSVLSSLSAGTTYYFHAYITYSGGSLYGTEGSFTTLNPCTAPTAPTALNLTSVTASGLSGSFNASSPVAASGYLVVRSTSSSLSANPSDGTSYTAGGSLGGGIVVQSSSATTFTQAGLTSNTTYYYYVFSYNNTSCTGGPVYSTSSLNANATTCYAAPVASAGDNITSSSFRANWAVSSGATGYLLDVSTSSSFTSYVSGYNALAVSGTSSPVTGLSPGTTYYYRVRATGTSCTSVNSSTITVSTTCGNYTLPLPQGFNATTIPNCWSTQTVVGTSAIQYVASSTYPSTTPQEGADFILWNSYASGWPSGNETRLVSPAITSTGTAGVDVSFYWYNENSTSYNTGTFLLEGVQVQYSLDGTVWTDAGSLFARYDATLTSGTGQWKLKTVSISGAGNQSTVYIGFKFHSSYGDNCSMDNILIQAASSMTYSSSAVTQSVTSDVYTNSTNNQVIGIQVVTSGSANPISATKFTVNTTGTTSISDITNAKIFYTGTSSTFATTTQFGSTVASPSGSFDITSSGQALSSGTNYFWLTYDIPSSATSGNVIDGECTNLTVAGTDYGPSPTTVSGNRTIQGAMSGTYNITGVGLFNKITGKNLYAKTFTRKVLREVPVEGTNLVKMSKDSKDEKLKHISEKTQLIEVDEEYSVLYEGDKVYEGPLYISKEEVNNYNKNLKDDNERIMSPNNETFATLTAAVTALNTRGISGAITFNLLGATYNATGGETFPIAINSISGMSSSNTLTIKPTKTATITGSSATSIIKLFGTDYVTIDGSTGTSSKDLTIENTNTGTSSAVIWIGSASASDGATNNTVKNCIIKGNSSTTTYAGIFTGSGNTISTYAETQNNNNTIQNNTVIQSSYGIVTSGPSGNETGLVISNNIVGSSTTSEKLGLNGIAVYQQAGAVISGNAVLGVNSSVANTITSGIYVGGTANGIQITKNSVSDIKNINSATPTECNGIKLISTSTSANVTLSNNTVCDVAGYGKTNYTKQNGYGIYIGSGGGYNLYYNSVNLATSQTVGYPACLFISSSVTTASTLDIRNNIFSIPATTGTRYAVLCNATNAAFSSINYNIYYSSGTSFGRYNSVDISSLSAWATATGKDEFSINADPGFTSATNLLPDVSNANCWNVNGKGDPSVGISTDYSGSNRSTTVGTGATDIGAYEITPNSGVNPADATVTYSSGSIIAAGITTTYSIGGRNIASIIWANPPSGTANFPTSLSVQYRPGEWPADHGTYEIGNVDWKFTASGTGTLNFAYDITLFHSPAILGNTGPNTLLVSKSEDNGSTWNAYTATAGSNNLTVSGLTSFSIFAITNNNSPLPVGLKSFTSTTNLRDVNLKWVTENEVNNSGFEILRCAQNDNGGQNDNTWAKVGFMNGNGTKNSPTNYTFTDTKLNSGKYKYRLKQIDNNGNFEYFDLSGVVEIGIPVKFNLSQNYPNPFNPTTKIDFDLPQDSKVSIKVYDISGKEVSTLVNDVRTAGYYTVLFDASNLSSGVYFYRIMTGDGKFVMTKKLLLMK